MTKKLTALLLAAALLTLCGCSLARPEAGSGEADRPVLVGLYITAEYLDLFDMEAYLNDNIDDIMAGKEVSADGSEYQGRIYARRVDDGRFVDYVFDDIEGIPYFWYSFRRDGAPANSAAGDGAITDSHSHFISTDEGERVELSGTLYLAARTDGSSTCYFNPVYQEADGDVFLTAGNGMMTNTDAEGAMTTTTLSDSITVTENGVTRTRGTTIELSVATMYAPERVTLLQMAEDSGIISREEYIPGSLPETLTPHSRCAYIIVETLSRDPNGGEHITRQLFSPDDETLYAFYCREDNVCLKQHTGLNWGE